MTGSTPGPRTRMTRSCPAHALGRYSPSAALAFRPRRAVSGVAYRAGGCKTVAQCVLALLGHQGQQDPALQQVQRRPRDALRMGSRSAVNIMLPCFASSSSLARATKLIFFSVLSFLISRSSLHIP